METQTTSASEIRAMRKPTYRKIVRWLWGFLILGLLAAGAIFFSISRSDDLPSFDKLENPQSELASQVYASDRSVLGRYYVENRVKVDYDELSPNLVKALIATEDERFFDHTGIDAKALARVAIRTGLLGQRNAGGGSTITQQLAKLLFSDRNFAGMSSLQKAVELAKRKFKEWIIAIRLERRYTKEEIIAMYLNEFNFINGAYGIKAATETYFGKSQDEVNMQEAALLIGMLKNPALFNPVRRPDTTLHRRMVVLKQMEKLNLITTDEYNTLKDKPLDLNFARRSHTEGLAPYFRMQLREEIKDILNNKAKRRSDGEVYDIYRDGLKVYTTIDPKLQTHAEAAMVEHMKVVQDRMWRTWRNKDPWTYREEETTDFQIQIREESLQRLVWNTERYQDLREKYMSKITGELESDIKGLRLLDRDISRIMKEHREGGHLTRLMSSKIIGSQLAATYRKVLKSDKFTRLQGDWNALQEAAEKSFNTKTKMRVFTYDNEDMEKDTMMSPLDSIKYHRMFLQIGSLAVEPTTGHVKAWIGGINHKYFQFDHVTMNRQVGSTFKPFVYATAIDKQGISPCYTVYDVPHTIQPGEGNFYLDEPWTPKNARGKYTGNIYTLKDGLKSSVNTVSVHLMKLLRSTEDVRDLARNMGINTDEKYSNGLNRVPKVPSICLGATDLSVMEMAGAYATFANNGLYNKPIFISRIEDKNGRLIYEEPLKEKPALSPKANYVMVEMLKYAAGLGSRMKSEAGGKTGTTNDYVDGWFMGITPNLVVGTWVGGEDRWIRFLTLDYGQGARMAKPFFVDFMNRIEKDKELEWDTKARFVRPAGDLGIELDCDLYDKASDADADPEDFLEDPFGDESAFLPQDSIKKPGEILPDEDF